MDMKMVIEFCDPHEILPHSLTKFKKWSWKSRPPPHLRLVSYSYYTYSAFETKHLVPSGTLVNFGFYESPILKQLFSYMLKGSVFHY